MLLRSLYFCLLAGVFLGSTKAHARPGGVAAACSGCHYGQIEGQGFTPVPTVTMSAATDQVAPGEQIEVTVTIEGSWDQAISAGFLIMGDEAGSFIATEDGTGNVGTTPEVPLMHVVGHTAARLLTDGRAEFKATWVAPDEVGTYDFEVFGVTSNDSDGQDDSGVSQEIDDSVGKDLFTLGVGCALTSYYADNDDDGFGAVERQACEPLEGHVLQAGDCNDENAMVNPMAAELCSFEDEDCDGDANEPLVQYVDTDGDGYGSVSDGLNVDSCEVLPGHSLESSDCDPLSADINPGAVEVINGIDDNCNAMIDEAAAPAPSATTPAPTTTGTGVAPVGTVPTTTPTAPISPVATSPTAVPTAQPVFVPTAQANGGCSTAVVRSDAKNQGALAWLALALGALAFAASRRRAS